MSELKLCPFCGGSANMCDCAMSCDITVQTWNTRPIEDALNARIAELERRNAKAKDLLEDEMGEWLPVSATYLPDHFLQLRQVLDVLDGGGGVDE